MGQNMYNINMIRIITTIAIAAVPAPEPADSLSGGFFL
jgi:hypothetical protein